jgi:hypothetical protein
MSENHYVSYLLCRPWLTGLDLHAGDIAVPCSVCGLPCVTDQGGIQELQGDPVLKPICTSCMLQRIFSDRPHSREIIVALPEMEPVEEVTTGRMEHWKN